MNVTIREDVEKKIAEGLLENKTLHEALYDICRKYGQKTALVDENGKMTYSMLWSESNRIAALFYDAGLRKGDNVLLQMPNSIEYVTVLFALFILGARPALMLQDHSETELFSVGELIQPTAFITVEAELGVEYGMRARCMAEKIPSIKKVFLNKETDYATSIYKKCNLAMLPFGLDEPAPYDIALFLLSGGTTGTPKVIPRIHAAYLCNAKLSAERCGVSEGSVYLAVLSTSHDYPLCQPGLLGTLFEGGKSVLARTASPEEGLDWIEKEGVTFTQLVPAVASIWVKAAQNHNVKLQHIEIGAAKLEWELATKIKETFHCRIVQGYGLGEGITCFTSVEDPDEVAFQTQGKPISFGDRIRIVDENGNDVRQGDAGELLEKGPYTFYGYYHAPERNKDIFTADGYLKTGDKALITKEGNLVILGRVREQINRAGENIIPEEIESFIRQCEYVKDVAVIGIPDEQLGEAICAIVVKKEKEMKLEELCSFLSTLKIAHYKYPDRLVYVDELPYINVGKVDKKRLKKQLLESER